MKTISKIVIPQTMNAKDIANCVCKNEERDGVRFQGVIKFTLYRFCCYFNYTIHKNKKLI